MQWVQRLWASSIDWMQPCPYHTEIFPDSQNLLMIYTLDEILNVFTILHWVTLFWTCSIICRSFYRLVNFWKTLYDAHDTALFLVDVLMEDMQRVAVTEADVEMRWDGAECPLWQPLKGAAKVRGRRRKRCKMFQKGEQGWWHFQLFFTPSQIFLRHVAAIKFKIIFFKNNILNIWFIVMFFCILLWLN